MGGGGLEVLFDGGSDVVRLYRATEAGENFSVRVEEDGVGDGFHGFDEVEGFGAWKNEWVADAMAFGKNEEASGWGIVEADPDKNKALGGVFFIEGG